ncbi:MAG: hypothetical protein FJW26_10300 [Acidimicrobiia bacterium]|nr:hypothetical protein [Acidimicrobiia bacterium]
MIELNQAAQCLFCPQRRKIALLLKLVMAGSAAIIVGIILFRPGSGPPAASPNARPQRIAVLQNGANAMHSAEQRPQRTAAQEAIAKKSAEVLKQARDRFQEVQSKIRPLLSEASPALARAQKLLDERRKEILKTKLLVLGEEVLSAPGEAEPEKKALLAALDKELGVLAEQKGLLAELSDPKESPAR